MRQSISGLAIAFIFISICQAAFADLTASFRGLGDLPGGAFVSTPSAVSRDGSVVVGNSTGELGSEAFRWTEATGIVGLGDLWDNPGAVDSAAAGVSADGSVIVGVARYDSGHEAYRWTANTGMVGLGRLPGGQYSSIAYGISGDGSVIVGRSQSASSPPGRDEAFRWTASTGMVGLGDVSGGGFDSQARATSYDGSVVVGYTWTSSGFEAFRWEDLNHNGQVDPTEKLDAHPELALGDLPEGFFNSNAAAVSANGSVVIGESSSPRGTEAYRWTEAAGMVGLGEVAGGPFMQHARGISGDGSIIVGSAHFDMTNLALIWSEIDGLRNLRDMLMNDYALDLSGWSLTGANAISLDGLTIVGSGINPLGQNEGWIVRFSDAQVVPLPGAVLLGVLGLTYAGVRLRRQNT